MLTIIRRDHPLPMKKLALRSLIHVLCLTVLYFSGPAYAQTDDDSAVEGAMTALDDFMTAFNSRTMDAWAETLHYPHVRFASGNVVVFQNVEEFAARPVFESLTRAGWDHSHWIRRDVTMSSANKVHVSTVFQRFDSHNEGIGSYQSLYILTRENGRWGVKARSSLAP